MDWWDFLAQQPEDGGCVLDAATFAAQLIAQRLPWLGIYDRSTDRERARSEITWLAAEGIWRYGQGQSIRRNDPALWAELTRRYPGLAAWG